MRKSLWHIPTDLAFVFEVVGFAYLGASVFFAILGLVGFIRTRLARKHGRMDETDQR